LEEAIREIVEPHTQTDPDFHNPYSYLVPDRKPPIFKKISPVFLSKNLLFNI
jgi:hypothetical protein